ncbi:MAG: hypothetical protein O8C62_12140 [Candidatus Methanoperedens sp.]|nr:hypothetical protein [Candidatus Methanoperedens sp.]
MANKSGQKKWTKVEIKKHVERIQKVIEEQKRLVKKGESFTAVTPEDIERKLKRVFSPMIVSQTGSWTSPTVPGGTISYNVGIYNPDPTQAIWLFAHVWVGSGNVDPTVGTFLLNVDTRFPRLTQPMFAGLTLAAGASTVLSFSLKVPSTVEKTSYLGNCCLMQFNWHDVGKYLDRGVFVFTVV